MRISTVQMYTHGVESFGQQQAKLAKLQDQISSGVRITKPSDDPVASARVLELQQSVVLHEQYQNNIDQANYRLNLEETALSATENLLIRVRELTIQSNNSSLDASNRLSIATEIDELFEEMLSLANTRDMNGDYLFAGYQNKTQPFNMAQTGAISHVVFDGDDGERAIQISQTRQMTIDTSAVKLFMQGNSDTALNIDTAITNTGSGVIAPAQVIDNAAYLPDNYQITFDPVIANEYDITDSLGNLIVDNATYVDGQPIEFMGVITSITGAPNTADSFSVSTGQYQDIFSVISNLSETLTGGLTDQQRAANYAVTLNELDSVFDKVVDSRTVIGGRMNALDAQQLDNEAVILSTKKTISTLIDTDLAEAISQLQLEQTTLSAAQAVFAKVTESTLFDYLR